MLGEAAEDYLKAIWKLRGEGRVTTSALASELGVSAASATGMLKKLAGLRLIEYEPYRGAALTVAGERVALEVVRHHRLLELYLTEALGLGWDEVHAEAERLEHHLSEELEAKIDEALGFPSRDPHGDPIPSVALELEGDEARPLADVEAGATVRVSSVPDEDAELLRYLGERELVPGRRVSVVASEPFEGPLTVTIAGEQQVLGRELARKVLVAEDEEE
ncbi:MAG: metal-dependent transcriptional regulator [Thermoleophilia bacterium]|nr:metal-dependent transcriptional regulator [Thermoleophilia bacterium]